MTKVNIDKIAEMFPPMVTDVAEPGGAKDAAGKPLLKKTIDFEKLKLIISVGTGDYMVAGNELGRHYPLITCLLHLSVQ